MGRHLSDGGWRSNMAAILLGTTPVSQRAEPSPLWCGTFPKRRTRRGTTRISRVRCGKAKRSCASRVPLPPGATARRTRGVLVVRATPPFFGAGAPRGRAKVAALCPPCGEVALSTVILGGKAIEPAKRPEPGTAEPRQRTSRPQLAHWPRPAPGGPWPLPPMSDAWNLTVASWPTVSRRSDP